MANQDQSTGFIQQVNFLNPQNTNINDHLKLSLVSYGNVNVNGNVTNIPADLLSDDHRHQYVNHNDDQNTNTTKLVDYFSNISTQNINDLERRKNLEFLAQDLLNETQKLNQIIDFDTNNNNNNNNSNNGTNGNTYTSITNNETNLLYSNGMTNTNNNTVNYEMANNNKLINQNTKASVCGVGIEQSIDSVIVKSEKKTPYKPSSTTATTNSSSSTGKKSTGGSNQGRKRKLTNDDTTVNSKSNEQTNQSSTTYNNESNKKKTKSTYQRKNIKKIIGEDKLNESTLRALNEEKERIQRLTQIDSIGINPMIHSTIATTPIALTHSKLNLKEDESTNKLNESSLSNKSTTNEDKSDQSVCVIDEIDEREVNDDDDNDDGDNGDETVRQRRRLVKSLGGIGVEYSSGETTATTTITTTITNTNDMNQILKRNKILSNDKLDELKSIYSTANRSIQARLASYDPNLYKSLNLNKQLTTTTTMRRDVEIEIEDLTNDNDPDIIEFGTSVIDPSLRASSTNNLLNDEYDHDDNDDNDDHDDDDDDDCRIISESEHLQDEQSNSKRKLRGLHMNDDLNVPNLNGQVLVNVNHPPIDEDIYLLPFLSKNVKPHQIGGIRFMYDNIIESLTRIKDKNSGFGCILAHAMGLGKTLQVISFIEVFLRCTNMSKRVLCIVPINTIQNWLSEFNNWLPENGQQKLDNDTIINYRRPFKVYLINDLSRTIKHRTDVILEWKNNGGVLLIGYEMFRTLITNKPTAASSAAALLSSSSKQKKNTNGVGRNASSTNSKSTSDQCEIIDLEEEEQTINKLTEIQEALLTPCLVVCDEGHRIKNNAANIAKTLQNIKTKRRVVLTGYPLQNNLIEYWCMVDFVRPTYLGNKAEFSNMFERPIMNGQCIDSTREDVKVMRYRAHVLHSLLEGFVQRRGHDVFLSTLPPKQEFIILLKLSAVQKELYLAFMEAIGATNSNEKTNPLRSFAICCKIWNHPDVLYKYHHNKETEIDLDLPELAEKQSLQTNGKKNTAKQTAAAVAAAAAAAASAASSSSSISGHNVYVPSQTNSSCVVLEDSGFNPFGMDAASRLKSGGGVGGFDPDWANKYMETYMPNLLENGAKFLLAFTIIEQSILAGDKILLFSQSLLTLNLIEEYLHQTNVPNTREKWKKYKNYFRLDGSTSGVERERLITQFNQSNNNVWLFLLSTRAGCLGINLIGANRVIVLDASWNPCHDAQAVCRVYRYGQKKNCFIYRLIADHTMEKKIYDRQISKQTMSDRVVDEIQSENHFTRTEVEKLIHYVKEDVPSADLSQLNLKYDDKILINSCLKHSHVITKEPFTHESLLIEKKEYQLSEREKAMAFRDYQHDKKYFPYTRSSSYGLLYQRYPYNQQQLATTTTTNTTNQQMYSQYNHHSQQQSQSQSQPMAMSNATQIHTSASALQFSAYSSSSPLSNSSTTSTTSCSSSSNISTSASSSNSITASSKFGILNNSSGASNIGSITTTTTNNNNSNNSSSINGSTTGGMFNRLQINDSNKNLDFSLNRSVSTGSILNQSNRYSSNTHLNGSSQNSFSNSSSPTIMKYLNSSNEHLFKTGSSSSSSSQSQFVQSSCSDSKLDHSVGYSITNQFDTVNRYANETTHTTNNSSNNKDTNSSQSQQIQSPQTPGIGSNPLQIDVKISRLTAIRKVIIPGAASTNPTQTSSNEQDQTSSIVIQPGQAVLLLETPKGAYLKTSSDKKYIAIRGKTFDELFSNFTNSSENAILKNNNHSMISNSTPSHQQQQQQQHHHNQHLQQQQQVYTPNNYTQLNLSSSTDISSQIKNISNLNDQNYQNDATTTTATTAMDTNGICYSTNTNTLNSNQMFNNNNTNSNVNNGTQQTDVVNMNSTTNQLIYGQYGNDFNGMSSTETTNTSTPGVTFNSSNNFNSYNKIEQPNYLNETGSNIQYYDTSTSSVIGAGAGSGSSSVVYMKNSDQSNYYQNDLTKSNLKNDNFDLLMASSSILNPILSTTTTTTTVAVDEQQSVNSTFGDSSSSNITSSLFDNCYANNNYSNYQMIDPTTTTATAATTASAAIAGDMSYVNNGSLYQNQAMISQHHQMNANNQN